MAKPIIALGIESSCDDTSSSIVTSEKKILSNIVLSQVAEHAPYKGVVPEIAARAHMNYMEHAIQTALNEANITLNDIDLIGATGGPGLIGGVIVGTMFGKSLSYALKKPYIAVNHLEGHLLAARMFNNIEYPFLTLLVSGGHAQFIAALEHGKYQILGQTLDDAPGEAFDKLAKMLDIGFPGGPLVEKHALQGDALKYKLPITLQARKDCDLSFSGLKTAARLIIEQHNKQDSQFIADICASFQHTATEILRVKSQNAMNMFADIIGEKNYSFVLSGGVAANKILREKIDKLCIANQCQLFVPPIQYCTDNAAMIAWAAIENYEQGHISNLNFCPRANWPLEQEHQ